MKHVHTVLLGIDLFSFQSQLKGQTKLQWQ